MNTSNAMLLYYAILSSFNRKKKPVFIFSGPAVFIRFTNTNFSFFTAPIRCLPAKRRSLA